MIAVLAGLAGCAGTPSCDDPAKVLGEDPNGALTCGDAGAVVGWIELLAGRPMADGDHRVALGAVRDEFRDDPAAIRALVADARTNGAELAARSGIDSVEARSHHVFLADAGRDLVRAEHGTLWNLQGRALSVWAKDPAEELAVTESDLEAWIKYASLCREAQGAGVLRLSVGDRVPVYQMLIERFDTGDRATKIAVSAFGPVWDAVKDHWQGAPYERQQRWIEDAPLPPPMNATSMGYADAIFQGDLVGHARALHDVLGPLPLGEPADFASAGGAR